LIYFCFSSHQSLRKIVFSFSLFIAFNQAIGQDIYQKYDIYRNQSRVLLNKISFSFSTGMSANTFRHNLSNFYYYQDANQALLIAKPSEGNIFDGSPLVGTGNWLNNPFSSLEIDTLLRFDTPYDYLRNPVNNPLLQRNYLLLDSDTISLGFENVIRGIPVNLGAYFAYKKFRLGGGFAFEQLAMRTLNSTYKPEVIRVYQPDFSKTWLTKWYAMGGYRFLEFWNYHFVLEGQIGRINYGKDFSASALSRGIYWNASLSIENIRSEYFKIFFKPGFDSRNYFIQLPDGGNIKHLHNTLSFQLGVTINIPEIPRSPYPSDHVQLKHVITDIQTGQLKEVRGQPFWKEQNPKVGQNDRKLFRYKQSNKRKLHPY